MAPYQMASCPDRGDFAGRQFDRSAVGKEEIRLSGAGRARARRFGDDRAMTPRVRPADMQPDVESEHDGRDLSRRDSVVPAANDLHRSAIQVPCSRRIHSVIDVATSVKLVWLSVQSRFGRIDGDRSFEPPEARETLESSDESGRMFAAGGVENP
jgi:hypothetical protein